MANFGTAIGAACFFVAALLARRTIEEPPRRA
jgi:hypothetical protein